MLRTSNRIAALSLILASGLLTGCTLGSMDAWMKDVGSSFSSPNKTAVAAGRPIPSSVVRRYDSALAVMQSGNDEKAQREFERFIKDYPEYPGAYLNLAILQERQEQPAKAMKTLEQAVFVNPGYAPAHNQMGILYREQGNFDAAAEAYQTAIDADPNYGLAYLNMGVLNDLYRQDPGIALNYYEQYRDLSGPDFDDAEVNRWILDLRRRVSAAQNTMSDGSAGGMVPRGTMQ